uniref:FH2 domain-containing protein n=1 Tax=Globodera pallida TaxID=36090 RepID=A0A183CR90_GLOPA
GGTSAQLFTGSKPGCEDDVLQARGEAKKVAQYGRGELSVADLKRRIERVMAQEEKRAVALMRLYAPKVRLVAAMLQQQDELTHEQIVQIIGPIPEKPSMWTLLGKSLLKSDDPLAQSLGVRLLWMRTHHGQHCRLGEQLAQMVLNTLLLLFHGVA